jgi:FAD synthase
VRDEKKFDGLPALVAQIERDCQSARNYFDVA